jgi:hypothetical protein
LSRGKAIGTLTQLSAVPANHRLPIQLSHTHREQAISAKYSDRPEPDEQVPVGAMIGVVPADFRRQRDYCRNACNDPKSAPSQPSPARSLTFRENLVQRRRWRTKPLFVFSDSHDDPDSDGKPHTIKRRTSEARPLVTPAAGRR